MAFGNNAKTNCKDWLKYIFNMIRCILYGCTQLMLDNGQKEKGWCYPFFNGEIELSKILH